MWEQVKRAIVVTAREVCGSMRGGGKNLKSVWWNDEIKATAERKEATWKEMLGARTEDAKERCRENYKKIKEGG